MTRLTTLRFLILAGTLILGVSTKSQNARAADTIPFIVTTEVTCDEVLQACDEALTSETAAHTICEEVVEVKEKKIQEDKVEIIRLSGIANHSHLPHIVGTSGFWLLLLILL